MSGRSPRLLLKGALVASMAAAMPAAAQQIKTYTQSQTGPNFLTYGLPVPLPIQSLTPVEGFRSYASLEARLQALALSSSDLSAHDVGRTTANRVEWAYVVSDEDGVDVEGRPEAAFFINATTHAREWAAPEVSTGTIERLIAGAGDGGFSRYLLDNTRLVIIPVHNIDGFLQAQRFPTDVIVGQDPQFPTAWPRDGRMRRKNMRGVDEVLTTFGDHLGGVDLNRNHPPFWATSVGNGGSSNNPNSLTYHGTAPHSEPENLAIERAAELAPVSRLRLGIDVHTFSRVFFSSNTARTRLNGIQTRLIGALASHHEQVAGKAYLDVPDPPNRGIGTAAEYFAYQWLVPAWTLELEPQNDPREYGGLNVEHGGFILPASEARRVREGWAESHALAFYMMAGPAHLARLRLYDATTNILALESRWQYDPQTARRTRVASGALRPGGRYRAELSFNKPMRLRDANGATVGFPGVFALDPQASLMRGSTRITLSTTAGTWINDPARVLRYRDDTFAFEFTAPDAVDDYRLEVFVTDLAGLGLDADASTPADWSQGAWTEWEDTLGVDGDVGGIDGGTTLTVSATAASLLELVADPRVVGEGDTVQVRMRRPQPGPERIEVRLYPPNGEFFPPPQLVATWLPGESGERSIPIAIPENLNVDGDRSFSPMLGESVDGVDRALQSVTFRVLENDASDAMVVRMRGATTEQFRQQWALLRSGTPTRHLVLDGGKTYEFPRRPDAASSGGLDTVDSDLRLWGNAATLTPQAGGIEPGMAIGPSGALSIDRVALTAPTSTASASASLLRNEGNLTLSRVDLRGRFRSSEPLIANLAALRVRRSLLHQVETDPAVALLRSSGAGVIDLDASTVSDSTSSPALQLTGSGTARLHGTTLAQNSPGSVLINRQTGNSGPTFGHTLMQANEVSSLQNCALSGISIGYNIEDHSSCGLNTVGDLSDVTLGLPPLSAILGGYAPIGAAVDGGATATQAESTGCGSVDQRGAPRPQTTTPNAQPRCDVGAIEAGINPYRGLWQPDRSGHGIDIHTAGNRLFMVWYTYGDDGQPTSYQAVAQLTGSHWEADLLQPRRNVQTGAITVPKVGRVSIDFASDIDARITWRFDARGVDGSERMRPALFATGEPRFEVTGVWYPPADSGYGATVTRRGEITGVVLYYYDALGNIRWTLGAGNAADAVEVEMRSYTGFCPDCNAATMPVTSVPAGTLLAHFRTPERARFDMQVTYPGTAGGSWNRERADFVPLNDTVDNRYTLGTVQ